jgi:hypothetical protein
MIAAIITLILGSVWMAYIYASQKKDDIRKYGKPKTKKELQEIKENNQETIDIFKKMLNQEIERHAPPEDIVSLKNDIRKLEDRASCGEELAW